MENIYYYVGYEKTDDGVKLYTTFPQAVHLLAKKKIEFYYSKPDGCMLATVSKVPANFGKVIFYEEHAVNKAVNNRTRLALAKDCSLLAEIDNEKNAAHEKWCALRDNLDKKEQDIKHRIFQRLQKNGPIVKKGRWYHRAILINTFRVYCETAFPKPKVVLDLEVIRDLVKKFKKHKTILESAIKLDSVNIAPELYERKVKHCLSAEERKKSVYEDYEVNEEALEKALPKLPYEVQRRLWEMHSPIDEDGNPIYEIHPFTHTAKNPECQECGGKFKKKTNECKDCGLESFVEPETKSTKSKAKIKKPTRLKVTIRDNVLVYKKSTNRKTPAKGHSRG